MPSAEESTAIRISRPSIVGDDTGPRPEYPRRLEGVVEHGFGRGSKDLGFPTANVTVDGVEWIKLASKKAEATQNQSKEGNGDSSYKKTTSAETEDPIDGVHFGWVSLRLPDSHPDLSTPPRIQTQHLPSSKAPKFAIENLKIPHPTSSNWRVYPMVMSIGFNPFYGNTERSAEVFIMNQFSEDFYGHYMRVSILGYIRKELNYVDLEGLVNDINTDVDVALKSLARKNWGVGKEESWLLGDGFTQEVLERATKEAGERAVKKAKREEEIAKKDAAEKSESESEGKAL